MKGTFFVLVALLMATVPAMAAGEFTEPFTGYTPGELVGQGGWTATGAGLGVIGVQVGDFAQFTHTGTAVSDGVQHSVNVSGDIIWWTMEVQAGVAGASTGNTWDTWLNDGAGKNYARWYGAYNSARPRIDGLGLVLPAVTLDNSWNVLGVKVDTLAHTSEFFYNGVSLGTLAHSAQTTSNVAANIIWGQQNASNGSAGSTMFGDTIHVGNTLPEPSSFMALGMFGLGALGFIKRRRA